MALTMLLLAATGDAQTFNFTTLAGNPASSGSANGTNSSAQFSFPAGVAVDSLGNLYVADQFNYTIRKITPIGTNWVVSTIAGTVGEYVNPGHTLANGTNSHAWFNTPTGIVADGAGNLYVADQGDNVIREIVPVGTNWVTTTLAGAVNGVPGSANGANTVARFNQPTGIALDAFTNLYVADQANDTIRKITPSGTNWGVATIAGEAGHAGTNDGLNNAASFNAPSGVAVDYLGRVFVADLQNSIIRLLAPSGTNWIVTTIAGQSQNPGYLDGAGTNAEFLQPSGVAVDLNDNVYVADQYNSVIRMLTPVAGTTNWNVSTIGGQAQNPGSSNGLGTNALFYYPYGLAVDSSGNLYIADTDNNTIRKGTLPFMTFNFLPPITFAQGQFNASITGAAGQMFVVQASTDLANWLPIWTNTINGASPAAFSDPQAGGYPYRFYRAVSP
jgi:hypothetical protein